MALRSSNLTRGVRKKIVRSKKRSSCTSTRPSAFKALLSRVQNGKAYFEAEKFDLANEYNPTTSIFSPQKNGVYVITASINYTAPNVTTSDIALTINGSITNTHTSNSGSSGSTSNTLTGIFNLKAWDTVEVRFVVFGSDEWQLLPSAATFFAAARVPSPAK